MLFSKSYTSTNIQNYSFLNIVYKYPINILFT